MTMKRLLTKWLTVLALTIKLYSTDLDGDGRNETVLLETSPVMVTNVNDLSKRYNVNVLVKSHDNYISSGKMLNVKDVVLEKVYTFTSESTGLKRNLLVIRSESDSTVYWGLGKELKLFILPNELIANLQ